MGAEKVCHPPVTLLGCSGTGVSAHLGVGGNSGIWGFAWRNWQGLSGKWGFCPVRKSTLEGEVRTMRNLAELRSVDPKF